MASQVKFTMLAACVLVLVAVVAAQYGGDGSGSDMPSNMPMGPAAPPSGSSRSFSYPAVITVLLPLILTFLAAKERI